MVEDNGSKGCPMLPTETLLEFKTRIKAFSHRYNSVHNDNPMVELELAEILLNGLDPNSGTPLPFRISLPARALPLPLGCHCA